MNAKSYLVVGAIIGALIFLMLGAKTEEQDIKKESEYRYEIHFRIFEQYEKDGVAKDRTMEYKDKIYVFDKQTGAVKLIDSGNNWRNNVNLRGRKFEDMTNDGF